MEDVESKLENAALARKERLKALKRKKVKIPEDENDNENVSSNKNALPKPKFRSYAPESEKLQTEKLPEPNLINIQEEVKDQLDSGKSKVVMDELDISKLAPRKPDWDLKRDVKKKLDRLEKRTQKAIAELIRERLKQNQNLADVNAIGEN